MEGRHSRKKQQLVENSCGEKGHTDRMDSQRITVEGVEECNAR